MIWDVRRNEKSETRRRGDAPCHRRATSHRADQDAIKLTSNLEVVQTSKQLGRVIDLPNHRVESYSLPLE